VEARLLLDYTILWSCRVTEGAGKFCGFPTKPANNGLFRMS